MTEKKKGVPILVIGNSHTTAIKLAVNKMNIDYIEVVNTTDKKMDISERVKVITPEMVARFAPEFVFCTFGGSEHSVFGLIESPVKFDFSTPMMPTVEAGRWPIPYGAVRATLERAVARARSNMVVLKDALSCPIQHLCSPAPFRDIADDAVLPGVFMERLQFGISPKSIRKKLHEVHSAVLLDICQALGIGFIDVPQKSVDEDGFLLPDLCTRDPTHGNAEYGKLVVQQILEATKAAA